jgi:putative transposase
MAQVASAASVDVFSYNLLPNHFHLLLRQREPGAISAYMHRVSCRSACHLRHTTASIGMGHVFQRRFWSVVVTDERHYLTVARYVEANALRAGLVQRAEDWPWGSLWERVTKGRAVLAPSPVPLPDVWTEIVNEAQDPRELKALRDPTGRGHHCGARPLRRGPAGPGPGTHDGGRPAEWQDGPQGF